MNRVDLVVFRCPASRGKGRVCGQRVAAVVKEDGRMFWEQSPLDWGGDRHAMPRLELRLDLKVIPAVLLGTCGRHGAGVVHPDTVVQAIHAALTDGPVPLSVTTRTGPLDILR